MILGAGELGLAMIEAFVAYRARHALGELAIDVALRPEALNDPGPAQVARRRRFAEWHVGQVAADFNRQDDTALAQCFAPYQAVINCSGFVGGPGTQLKITRAVLAAGVPRYVPWQFGVDYDVIGTGSGQPVWDEQLAVRDVLRAQQATEWLIVSTGIFTSYLFEPGFGVVDRAQRQVIALGAAEHALTVTTPEDIGQLTAAIFFHTPAFANEVVYVAGDTLSWRQLADVLGHHYHEGFSVQVRSTEQLRADACRQPGDAGAAYRLAFARPNGIAWPKAETFNARQHLAVTDVAGWLRRNAPV